MACLEKQIINEFFGFRAMVERRSRRESTVTTLLMIRTIHTLYGKKKGRSQTSNLESGNSTVSNKAIRIFINASIFGKSEVMEGAPAVIRGVKVPTTFRAVSNFLSEFAMKSHTIIRVSVMNFGRLTTAMTIVRIQFTKNLGVIFFFVQSGRELSYILIFRLSRSAKKSMPGRCKKMNNNNAIRLGFYSTRKAFSDPKDCRCVAVKYFDITSLLAP
ncbi:hypothetical protein BCR42DRAFT_390249 [Absidia repens]|uniref:Uncharacterized protein n=1 Tax=Absidia repens TaxID=90262 RepID=A0A1X2INK4_9FUNG|nr:hypothetical protein BCR42DRAFT_390249 [Absidia repens]